MIPSDEDYSRGWSQNKDGSIHLIRPLKSDDLSDLINRFPKQLNSLTVQQVELEIAVPARPVRSKVSITPNGYVFLVPWANACLLRILVTRWFWWFKTNGVYRNLGEAKGRSPGGGGSPLNSSKIPYSPLIPVIGPALINRMEGQLDHLRSVIANIEEGFARPTTISYLEFLGFSAGSLVEGKGDIQRWLQDGFLRSVPGSGLTDLGIDLKEWHAALRKSVISRPAEIKGVYGDLGEVRGKGTYGSLREIRGGKENKGVYGDLGETKGRKFEFGYPPVDDLDPAEITYEMLIELVNKTDWNLRQLAGSLEAKLNREHKFYQVEKARMRFKAWGSR